MRSRRGGKEWVEYPETTLERGVGTGGGPSEECKPESSQFLLFEPGIEGEEISESSEEIARAKGVDAIL